MLLAEDGTAIGTAAKAEVHHRGHPAAPGVLVLRLRRGRAVPLTQRAQPQADVRRRLDQLGCGHPAPGEPIEDAVRRRVGQELGLTLDDLRLVLPGFRYRAVMDNGVTENEMCPVFVATTRDAVRLDPEEVDDHEWVDWPEFRAGVLDGTRDVSTWCVEQVTALPQDPRTAGSANRAELPPAARTA